MKSAKNVSGQCRKLVTAGARIWCILLTTEKHRQHIILWSTSYCGAEEGGQGGTQLILMCTMSPGNPLQISSSNVYFKRQQTRCKQRLVANGNGALKLSRLCVEKLLATPEWITCWPGRDAPDVILRDVTAEPVGEVEEAVVERDEDVGDQRRHLRQHPALHLEPWLPYGYLRGPQPVAALRRSHTPTSVEQSLSAIGMLVFSNGISGSTQPFTFRHGCCHNTMAHCSLLPLHRKHATTSGNHSAGIC